MDQLPELSEDSRQVAAAWLAANQGNIPAAVVNALRLSMMIPELLQAGRARRQSLMRQLRRALGILPSSERRGTSGQPLSGTPQDKPQRGLSIRERLEAQLTRAKKLNDWYANLSRRHARKIKELEGRIVELEDIEFSAAEEAEFQAADARHLQQLELGQRCDLDCAGTQETLMSGGNASVRTDHVDCTVDREMLAPDTVIKQQFFEDRERISFSFSVTRLNIAVEKLAIETQGDTKLITASVADIGPPKSKVTWQFLTNMTILVGQYAMPLNRFAGLVSSEYKQFSAGEMSRHVRYVAERLEPVYLQLARDLANSAVLQGDDTPSRVIEVTKALEAVDNDPRAKMPWEAFATRDKAKASAKNSASNNLSVRLAQQFGFESERKDGKGSKRRLNTTVLSGRSDAYDPRSHIVFFRSHLGSLGNLLDQILQSRDSGNERLIIQSDLSTTNLISDPHLRQRLQITHAGCASHARRTFAIYEDQDPDLCSWILHSFKGLAIFEQSLDIYGRNRDNVTAVRTNAAQQAWDAIKTAATMLAEKWSSKTELGEAARYILRNFPALTYYLQDYRIAPNNNFSERMLRMERLIENNALFRKTLQGRFALDIIRSVLQTGIAAQVDLQLYLNWLLQMPHEDVMQTPDAFTPLAFARLSSQVD